MLKKNNMKEINNIFKEIGEINKLYFESKIHKKVYFDTLKPIYKKLKKTINDSKENFKPLK